MNARSDIAVSSAVTPRPPCVARTLQGRLWRGGARCGSVAESGALVDLIRLGAALARSKLGSCANFTHGTNDKEPTHDVPSTLEHEPGNHARRGGAVGAG